MLLEEIWLWILAVMWHLEGRLGITSVAVELTTVGSSMYGPWWWAEPEQSLHVSTRNDCRQTGKLWWDELLCICVIKNSYIEWSYCTVISWIFLSKICPPHMQVHTVILQCHAFAYAVTANGVCLHPSSYTQYCFFGFVADITTCTK